MARESLPARWGGYLLLERLATGGMAEVYLAIDESALGGRRFVVVKRVREDYGADPEYAQFFLTEGRVSLLCHHPNLPFAYELGEADGRAFLVLEYLRGHAVLQVLRAVATAGRGVGIASAAALGIGIARALEHLHALTDVDGTPLHVIHRDVSPHNVIVAPGGVVKLIDLGIARAAIQSHRTETGVVKGKYAYMAPEQLGLAAQLDGRADLFSLGAMMHELLVGRALFQGSSDLDTCERVRNAPIPHPQTVRDDVPRAIADVVMTALERDPDRRWPSAGAFADALEAAAVRANAWPSEAGLWSEVVSLCGPPARPEIEQGVLAWKDRRLPSPRLSPRAQREGTVMEASPPIEEIEDQPSEPVDDPDAPKAPLIVPETPRPRDPALSYYLHVGAVKEGEEEDPEKKK
ncbi:MAG TPA: serine/threonine-protein kinase [Kofleriaceae bacterium]|nr:serine/threonine-protein kinase [Kofleriaceae bacterium]